MTAEAKSVPRTLSFTNPQEQVVGRIVTGEDLLSNDQMTVYCYLLQVPTDADMEWISALFKKVSYIFAHKHVNVEAVCKKHGYVMLRERDNHLFYVKL